MKKTCLRQACRLLAAICFCIIPSLIASAQDPTLYVSKQTNKSSSYQGSYSKQTDAYEQGNVTISGGGLLDYQITPEALTIQPNENKTWNGSITANVESAPEPGGTNSAYLMVDYTIKYSRPYGEGVEGTVTSTYYCSKDGSAAGTGGCAFHEGAPGVHEMVEETGQKTKNFSIVSILVDVPDTICLGGTGQKDVTAVSFPADAGNFKWTCSDASVVITNGDQKTAGIKMTDTTVKNAVLEVEFEINGVTYKDKGVLSTCECNCKTLTAITPGPLSFTFDAPPQSTSPDGQGNCQYVANDAKFTLDLNGAGIQRQLSIPGGTTVTFGKSCENGALTEVAVDWTGEIEIPELVIKGVKVIKLTVKEIHLTVSKEGNLDGTVKIKAENPEDRDILGNGFVWLRKGTNTEITFKFKNENSFTGDFDFSGLHGIVLEMVKKKDGQDVVIADFNSDVNKDGVLKGDFKVKPNNPYVTSQFTVDISELTLGMEIKLSDGDFKLTSGSGKAKIKDIKGLNGTVDLAIAFADGNGSATVAANSDIKAFTMVFSELKLQVDFNSNFDITKVTGAMKAKHEKFNVAVNVSEFTVENGALTKFSADGKVKYSAFEFTLLKSEYTADPSQLEISAEVALNATGTTAKGEIKGFKINEAGEITVGSVSATFTRAPASFKFDATFGQNKFAGTFSGDFAAIGLDGSIDVGAEGEPAYNYAYFSITAKGNVPLGNSGLKLTKVGGSAGFNYKLNFPGGGGQPEQYNYVIGLKLGVADVADMCGVEGEAVVQFNTFSGNTILTLNGKIDVLKNNPFFSGNMNVNYRIPQNMVDGQVGAVVKVPSSGFILSTDNCNVSFQLGGGQWSANGNNMGGKMFNGFVTLSGGHINMSGPLNSATSMTGSVGGNATASFGYGMSASFAGNSITGNVQFNLNANIDAQINQGGLSGTFGVNANGTGTLTMDTWLGSETFQASAVANGNVGYNGGNLNLSGNVDVTLPFSIPWYGNQFSTGVNISI
jgi:hypothetical protein